MAKVFSDDLQELRDRPIPQMDVLRQKRGYRSYPIDTIQALYDEPLIDIDTLGIEGKNHYSHADNPPYFHKFPGAARSALSAQDGCPET